MKTEYEVKFVKVDVEEIRVRLESLGGILVTPMRTMKRLVLETPELKAKGAFIRIRDEGDKVTLTYKQFAALSIDGAQEHEIVVSDFDETKAILAAVGLSGGSFQESKRETWKLDDAEVVIDVWPWLEPYIEVEGESAAHVRAVSEKLGFDWSDAVFGDVMAAYRVQYPHLTEQETVGNLEAVRFDDPLPSLLIASTESKQ